MSSQRQCHRLRKQEKAWIHRHCELLERLYYLESRPPVWRIWRYIKWLKEGAERWPK